MSTGSDQAGDSAPACGAHERWIGIGLVLIAASGFGLLPVLARIAYNAHANLSTFLALRFSIAGVILWIWVLAARHKLPRARLLVGVLLLGVVGYVLQSFTYFASVEYADVSIVAAVSYTYPILVMLLAAVTRRDRLTPLKIGALAFAVIGSVLMVTTGGHASVLGIVLAALAGAIYAVYFTASEWIIPTGYATACAAVIIGSAAVVFWIAVLGSQQYQPPEKLSGWIALAAVSLGSTVISITALLAGLQRLKPLATATLSAAEPVVSVVLAVALLGESMTLAQVLGFILVLVSAITVSRLTRPVASLDAVGPR